METPIRETWGVHFIHSREKIIKGSIEQSKQENSTHLTLIFLAHPFVKKIEALASPNPLDPHPQARPSLHNSIIILFINFIKKEEQLRFIQSSEKHGR